MKDSNVTLHDEISGGRIRFMNYTVVTASEIPASEGRPGRCAITLSGGVRFTSKESYDEVIAFLDNPKEKP